MRQQGVHAWSRRFALVAVASLLVVVSLPGVAAAHGGDESKEGYLLVQQALGHLAHDTSSTGIDLAMEKVDDALAASDHEGVAVAEVTQAKKALEAGQAEPARTLLQDSIKEALLALPPPVGSDTGTKTVMPTLPGRSGLSALDWSFLFASVVLAMLGVALAVWFRPADSLRTLRRRLLPGSVPPGAGGEHLAVDGRS